MALYRCGSGGATSTETVLWTNGSPTSAFGAQTITLSDIVTNYDYLKITGRWSTTDDTSRNFIYPTTEMPTNQEGAVDIGMKVGSSGDSRVRGMYLYGGDDKLYFSQSYRLSSNAQTPSSNYMIPTQIIGIKEA